MIRTEVDSKIYEKNLEKKKNNIQYFIAFGNPFFYGTVITGYLPSN